MVVAQSCQLLESEMHFVSRENSLSCQIEQTQDTFILRSTDPAIEALQALSKPRLEPCFHDATGVCSGIRA